MGKLKIEYLPLNALHPNAFNSNVVSPENEAKIDASLRRLGAFKPILARETVSGLEILGGQHRWESAARIGMNEVPVINLGPLGDREAKEISLVDNGRYGNDDSVRLAALLEELGDPEDLAAFMPYTDADLNSIFATSNIALDDLDSLDLDDTAGSAAPSPTTKVGQTHAIMRFKVPVEDVATITAKVNAVMKRQRFDDEDSLTNAGNALVHIFQDVEV